MADKAARVFYRALWMAARNSPDSVVADLLAKFSVPVVAKLVKFYSGQQIQIPYEDDIWKTYRNREIRKILDMNNDRVTRNNLARLFGVTRHRVSAIYREEKKKFPKSSKAIAKGTAKEIYDRELCITKKEITEVSSNRL